MRLNWAICLNKLTAMYSVPEQIYDEINKQTDQLKWQHSFKRIGMGSETSEPLG